MSIEWDRVEEKVGQSKIFRFPYKGLLGKSLTATILENRKLNYSAKGCYQMIMGHKQIKTFLLYRPDLTERLQDHVWTSVCSRYSENKQAERYRT